MKELNKMEKAKHSSVCQCVFICPPQKYLYFVVVVGLVWSNDPQSYAGDSVATGRASHGRQVKGDGPDKRGYSGPPGWGLGHEANNLTSGGGGLIVEKRIMHARWIILVKDQGKVIWIES